MPHSVDSDSSGIASLDTSPSKKKWQTHSHSRLHSSHSPDSKGKGKKSTKKSPFEDSVAMLIKRNMEDRQKV